MSEEWRIIAEFPDYAVSSEGRVKRIKRGGRGQGGNILKPQVARYEYLTLYCDGKPYSILVHRLVCKAFHGEPPSSKHEVAHGDGNNRNNKKDNSRWTTHSENEADKVLHGTNLAGRPSWVPVERRPKGTTHGRHTMPDRTARGERGGLSKLTESSVTAIRLDVRPRKILATEYGVSVTMIGYIQRGLSWSHVPMPQNYGESQ